MSDREPGDGLSLELPSLGGGWRRRRRKEKTPVEQAPEAETVAEAPPPLAPELDEPAPAPAVAPAVAESAGEQTTVLEVQEVADPPPTPRAPRSRPTLRLPGGWVAVVVTGLLVGLVVVGLTWGSLRTCEAVQGTSSCGTAGYPMLALVLALAVLAGSLLLRLARVPDPVSTSLLAVGSAAVIALLVLIDHLDQPAMVVVIPVICAVTFAGSHWLTTTVIEPDRD